MFQNLRDDRVRDVLLALSVGAMFLYGFYIMKKEMNSSRRYKRADVNTTCQKMMLTNTKVICYNNKGDSYDC